MLFIKRTKLWSKATAVAEDAANELKKSCPKVKGSLLEKLREFLIGPEGQWATHLLRAANRNVILARIHKKRGHAEIYLLTGWGFQKLNAHSGELIPVPLIPDPPISKVSVEEVAVALKKKYPRTSSRYILRRMKSEIDRIADEILKAS